MDEIEKSAANIDLDPGLYVVATPIGNARDITLRALDILGAADLVLCEDTRVTGKLMMIHGLKPRLRAYHDHNAAKVRASVVKELEKGARVALVSDAGTPLISDPGYKLVAAAIDAGVAVTSAPGASSVLSALMVAGAPTDRFFFAGFLPPKTVGRRRELKAMADVPGSLVFLESGRRLAATLSDMTQVFAGRSAVVARELTKKFEEVRRGDVGDLSAYYAEAGPPKGEIVIVVAPAAKGAGDGDVSDEALTELLAPILASASVRDAASEVAEQLGVPRRRVYELALALQKNRDPS
jgi:16S rRNA (cytidine1402-2'-O)-methyltransferase